MRPKLHHKLLLQGDWVSRGINGLPVPCFSLPYLPEQHTGNVGVSLRVQVLNLGYLNPDPFWEVSLFLTKALSCSLHLQRLSLNPRRPKPSRDGFCLLHTVHSHVQPSPWHTHTHTRFPPLLPPADVTLLLVGSLIPFLTF